MSFFYSITYLVKKAKNARAQLIANTSADVRSPSVKFTKLCGKIVEGVACKEHVEEYGDRQAQESCKCPSHGWVVGSRVPYIQVKLTYPSKKLPTRNRPFLYYCLNKIFYAGNSNPTYTGHMYKETYSKFVDVDLGTLPIGSSPDSLKSVVVNNAMMNVRVVKP
jgi:hypothetical protein